MALLHEHKLQNLLKQWLLDSMARWQVDAADPLK